MDTTKLVETSKNHLRLRGLPLQQRLPLLICVLLLVIMITFSLISYQGVKNAALKSGKERLLSLTSQLSSMFSQSTQNLLTATRKAANQSSIKNFLRNDGPKQTDSALQVLEKIREDSTSVLIDLLNANYQLVLRSGKDAIEKKVNFDSLLLVLAVNRDTAVGKIYAVRDSMYYPIIAPVTDNKQITGYIIRWRWLSATPQTIEQLSQLMGTRATFFIGNADGSLWTDMIKPVSHYFLDTGQFNKPIDYTSPGGHRFITAAQSIAHTPWLASVEFSRQLILESATRFLKWMIIAGLVLLIIGIFTAWIMSRNIIQPLNRLTAATSGVADGNYTTTTGIERRDEVGKLARAFNSMIEQVREARQRLEQKIAESGEMNEQLRNLTAHLQNIREEERIHIAREMHDELGQLLTAFKMDVSWLNKKLADTSNDSIREKLIDMEKHIDNSVAFVRKLATELRPSVLDDFGLISALEWHSDEFAKRFNIEIEFNTEIKELKTSSLIATGLFRMYQESLTNVARHAEATKVKATLKTTKEWIYLSIHDNGKGFDLTADSRQKTLGLLGMKERATMIGGKLEINSEPGKGTSIMITVPLNV